MTKNGSYGLCRVNRQISVGVSVIRTLVVFGGSRIESPRIRISLVIICYSLQILGFYLHRNSDWNQDGLEGISTSYGLDGSEFESWEKQGVFYPAQAVKIITVDRPTSYSMITEVQSRG